MSVYILIGNYPAAAARPINQSVYHRRLIGFGSHGWPRLLDTFRPGFTDMHNVVALITFEQFLLFLCITVFQTILDKLGEHETSFSTFFKLAQIISAIWQKVNETNGTLFPSTTKGNPGAMPAKVFPFIV